MKYARIFNNSVVEIIELADNIQSRTTNGEPVLRPLVYNTPPTFNIDTQKLQERYVVTSSAVLVEHDIVPIFADVAVCKSVVSELINRWRDEAARGDVLVHGSYWQADKRSRELLSDAITLASAGAPLPPVWRDAANQNMTITNIGELVTIASAIAASVQAAYTRSWELKEYVSALPNTPEATEILSQLTWNTVI